MGNVRYFASSRARLLEPVRLGRYRLVNRVVMAPMMRCRAGPDGVPDALMAEYYAQRAGAGLIIGEGADVSPQARGHAGSPGLYNDAQVEGWRAVTEAVHARGGLIFAQLAHAGRVSDPSLQPGGGLPVAPSAIWSGAWYFAAEGFRPCRAPRALETDEVPKLVEQYRQAAERALAAGFDGVEIHAAEGYLIEEFLRDSSNQRTDAYGGSIARRARFLLEVTEAVVGVAGGARTGVRLSPLSQVNGAELDRHAAETYGYVVEALNPFSLAYLHVVEGETGGPREVPHDFDLRGLRRLFNGLYIANNGYDLNSATNARRRGHADLVSFGRLFIANPDLVERFRSGAPLSAPHNEFFFAGAARGYTDYPALGWAARSGARRRPSAPAA
jgi:N-ethylmaleimide reductase